MWELGVFFFPCAVHEITPVNVSQGSHRGGGVAENATPGCSFISVCFWLGLMLHNNDMQQRWLCLNRQILVEECYILLPPLHKTHEPQVLQILLCLDVLTTWKCCLKHCLYFLVLELFIYFVSFAKLVFYGCGRNTVLFVLFHCVFIMNHSTTFFISTDGTVALSKCLININTASSVF